MIRTLTAALGLAILSSGTASGQALDASNEKAIADLLQAEGYRAKLEVLDDGEPVIRSSNGGVDFSIYFYDCDDAGTNCKNIQFYVGYDLTEGMTLEAANAWNKDFRFGKVYLDEEMDPAMEMDVNMDFGVSSKNFLDTFDWWLVVMDRFQEEIDW